MMTGRLRLLCWALALAIAAVARAQSQTDALLDECERRGEQSGTIGSRAACAVMTSKCPPPSLEDDGATSRSLGTSTTPEDLFGEVIRETCELLFRTKCKNAAVAGAFADNSLESCQQILIYGPGEGSPDCEDFDAAIGIFDGVLSQICEQEAEPGSIEPPPPPAAPVEVLVSRGQPTFQSTTAYRGDSSRAVDGNLDPRYKSRSCSHTGNGSNKRQEKTNNPWWVVDLGESKKVKRVKITNRRDCCSKRLSGFEIRVGDTRPGGKGADNQVCSSGLSLGKGETRDIVCEGTGRFVTVRIPGNQKILTLCEVEVFAEEAVEVPKEVLVSRGQPTFQSTTAYRGDSSRAVDGNLNANFRARSCSHTGNGSNKRQEKTNNPWWVVDLGETKKVKRVEITNRRDCCGYRLSNFEIRVGDTKPRGGGAANVVCSTGLGIQDGQTKNFACEASGRYVTVRIPGNQKILTLCEVEVFAEASIVAVIILFLIVVLVVGASRKSKSSPKKETTETVTSNCASQNIDPFVAFDLDFDFRNKPRKVEVENGAVATDQSFCAEMGLDILKKGGNAVDSMVTTTLCQGIMSPTASGIGGGAFIVIRMNNGSASVIDARETAPAGASWDMFNGTGKMASQFGGLAVAVPLELKGLEMAHKEYGRLPWATLFDPVYDIAENGFEVHPELSVLLMERIDLAIAQESARKAFYIKDGPLWRPPRVGEVCCKRPGLAKSLRKAAEDGVDALYKDIAQPLVDAIAADNFFPGVMTVDDILNAKPVMKEPLRASVFGMEVLTMPLPSSAAAVVTALKLLDILEWPEGDLLRYHWLVEACKTMYALRMHFGYPTPDTEEKLNEMVKTIIQDDFAKELSGKLDEAKVLARDAYGGQYNISSETILEDHGTTHISIVDKERNAVAITSTVNTILGSMVYSESTGVLLNSQMDDFSRPDTPNFFDVPPSEPNFIAAGKKPISSMSPMIFVKDGKVREVVGASGGTRIMSSILQTAFRTLKLGKDPKASVIDPMLHDQLSPDHVLLETLNKGPVETSYDPSVKKYLEAKGNKVVEGEHSHSVELISVDPETNRISAVSDPRKDGAPAGY
ncbi:hypothetical protein BSKO_01037 [Bryopsis sp. KO-2023]|nr:hypothetical protein BSKO_01037 [Bryopsis sp. KO-2023]